MREFRSIDIRKLDGGLLLVFRELMRCGQAKLAGERVGLSQPAVSHALARLRDLFGDPLFIRKPHGLEPTRRALELAPQIEALIELAGAAVARGGRFDPASSDRVFTIGGYDAVVAPFASGLITTMRKEAPRAAVRFVDMLYWTATESLLRGEIDLAVGQFGKLPPGLVSQTLFKDDYCIIARRGHPRIRGRMTEKIYREAGHVFVLPPARNDGTPLRPAETAVIYGTIPDRRRVAAAAYVQRFSASMMLVATSDAIADVPRRFAERYAGKLGLQMLDMPFDWPGFKVDIVRRADHRDPATDWLHQKVLDSTGS